MNAVHVDVVNAQPAPLAVPPTRRRGMFVGLLAAVFLSGGIAGAGIGWMIAQRQFLDDLRHPGRLPDRMTRMVRNELGLSEEQSKKVDEIMHKHHEVIEAIRAETRPRMVAEFNAIGNEVAQVLTEEQKVKWQAMRERFGKDSSGPARRGHNRDSKGRGDGKKE